MLLLLGRAKPICDSRRRSLVPGSVDDLSNTLVLQVCLGAVGRSETLLVLLLILAMLLLTKSSQGLLWLGLTVMAIMAPGWRLVEQDEVLLRGLALWELLRGWCRQAGRTGRKPCWLGIRGEDWEVLAGNGGGIGERTRARAYDSSAEVQINLYRKSWILGEGLSGECVLSVGLNFAGWKSTSSEEEGLESRTTNTSWLTWCGLLW
jgi:hypothetical protein